jgi:hypothetical protein
MLSPNPRMSRVSVTAWLMLTILVSGSGTGISLPSNSLNTRRVALTDVRHSGKKLRRSISQAPQEDALRRPELQVLLEDRFFPWIVYNAVMGLLQNGHLKSNMVSTTYVDKVTFL